jgi:hypothetical protein
MYANLILADLIRSSTECAITDVEQKFGQEGRLREALAGHDSPGKLPTRIFRQAQRFPDRLCMYQGTGH